jgi:5-methylcytosine-specific restriction enzyme A
MPWQTDHTIALINGGENRESNLRTILTVHHISKTAEDVAEKSIIARKRKAILGIKKSRNPMPGSKRSKYKKKMDGTIVRR